MTEPSRFRSPMLLGLAGAVALAAAGAALWFVLGRLPGPGSEVYREYVSAFHSGVAGLEVSLNEEAGPALTRATELIPEEPAGWANRGLLQIRQDKLDEAAADLEKARLLAPDSGEIEALLGLLESQRGDFDQAIAHYRLAAELNPGDVKSRYALVKTIERQGGNEADAAIQEQLEGILEARPGNLAALLDLARVAAKRGDAATLKRAIEGLQQVSADWPEAPRKILQDLVAADAGDPRATGLLVQRIRNYLAPTPAFRQDIQAIQIPTDVIGEPILNFIRLDQPSPTASTRDDGLAYTAGPIDGAGEGTWEVMRVGAMTSEGDPAIFVANGREARLISAPAPPSMPFPGGESATPPSPDGLLLAALRFGSPTPAEGPEAAPTAAAGPRADLVMAGAAGLKIYRQADDGSFTDITVGTNLPPEITGADLHGVWAADFDLDGDLDLILGPREGAPPVLRNNGDDTFEVLRPFEDSPGLIDFAWADFDRDGDPDPVLLGRDGLIRRYTNDRGGLFRPVESPGGGAVDLAVADLDGDGGLDLLLLGRDWTVRKVSGFAGEGAGTTTVVGSGPKRKIEPERLIVADLDNNGGLDIIVPGADPTWALLAGEESGNFALKELSPVEIFDVVDLNSDGLLDLASLDADGRPQKYTASGTKGYHWQLIRPQAVKAEGGDGRINPFAIGGEIELRAGLLVQKQLINGPLVHFGLGDRPVADVARIIWPNGTVQAEFGVKADQSLLALQRLKGSCPFLFAFDGDEVRFVTDFLWRSPLGLRINGQDTAGVSQTEDWVKIRGDQLAPRDGFYDIRITADLWETHFFDHMALMVVDHPVGTEVFVDERFSPRQPPPLAVQATGPLRPVARATDDLGDDVLDFVRTRDGKYLDTFGRGTYQGITRDHWVEIELGSESPADAPLILIAHGWTHPTDSSLNVAISQGKHQPPKGLLLEVPGSDGTWKVAVEDIGFPAGKNKTVLVPLEGILEEGGPRKFRLRTNLEIYWDAIEVAEALTGAEVKLARLAPVTAELRYRGFSRLGVADPSSPEIPEYNLLEGTGQRWLDLVGFYTRFGDVLPLLDRVDDRYIIANAGDELLMRFPAPPPPGEGWVRDFVMIGDGWNKDGDFNTAFSKTVLPLPLHDQPSYNTPPTTLEDDPAYRRHPGDWAEFHTRYVAPREFLRGLRPASAGAGSPKTEPGP